MFRHPYVRAVIVLLLALVSTGLYAVALWTLLTGLLPESARNIGLELAAASIFVVAPASIRHFAIALLFDKDDEAPLQMIGGVRLGSFAQAMAHGTGATWPFAKLSASHDALRLQTPFGVRAWDRAHARIVLRQTIWRTLAIDADGVAATDSILFMPLPWQRGRLFRTLRELGYEVRGQR